MQEVPKNKACCLIKYPPLVFWILNLQTEQVALKMFRSSGIQTEYKINGKFPDDYSWSYSKICKLGSDIRRAGFYPKDHNMMRTVRRAIKYFNNYEPWHYAGCNVMIDWWWNGEKTAQGLNFYAE